MRLRIVASLLASLLLCGACQSASSGGDAPALPALVPANYPVALRSPSVQLRIAECGIYSRLRIEGRNFWADPGRSILAVTVVFESAQQRGFELGPLSLVGAYSQASPEFPGMIPASTHFPPELIILVGADGRQSIAPRAVDAAGRALPGQWLARRYLWTHRTGFPPDTIRLQTGVGQWSPARLQNCGG